MPGEVTLDTLKGFLDAFNRYDLDAIMAYFHDDCVFYMPRGKGPRGDRYVGTQQVRAGLGHVSKVSPMSPLGRIPIGPAETSGSLSGPSPERGRAEAPSRYAGSTC